MRAWTWSKLGRDLETLTVVASNAAYLGTGTLALAPQSHGPTGLGFCEKYEERQNKLRHPPTHSHSVLGPAEQQRRKAM